MSARSSATGVVQGFLCEFALSLARAFDYVLMAPAENQSPSADLRLTSEVSLPAAFCLPQVDVE
jgi:hypothetical protein